MPQSIRPQGFEILGVNATIWHSRDPRLANSGRSRVSTTRCGGEDALSAQMTWGVDFLPNSYS